MPVQPGLCAHAKLAWLQSMANDDIWIALYGKDANLSPFTTHYTTSGEVAGPGYTRGGLRLTGFACGIAGKSAWLDFDDPRWDYATITAYSALIYNRSRNNLALVVLPFNEPISSTNAPWWLEFPPPVDNGVATAVIRLR